MTSVRPNSTFTLLVALSTTLLGVIAWSIHHLLLAGAPELAVSGEWPGVRCLLVPAANDLTPHLGSYAFLLAIAAGAACGARTLVRQHAQTRVLLRTCLSARIPNAPPLVSIARSLGLDGQLDVVDIAAPLAFCYGYLRPRVLVSVGLLELVRHRELEALLLHEREHLRQRDPLKIALGRLLTAVVFFMPAAKVLYRRYLLETELAADMAAIGAQGDSSGLAAALVTLLDCGEAIRPAHGAGAGDALEARIDLLLGDPVRARSRLGRIPLAGSLAILLLATLPLLGPSGANSPVGRTLGDCHLITAADVSPAPTPGL